MLDALGNIAESSEKFSSAVKTVKLLRDKNSELCQMIEIAETYASQIEELDLPPELTEELDMLKKLRQELQNMLDYRSRVSVQYKGLCDEIKEFESFLTAKMTGSTIPPEVTKQFCGELRKINDLEEKFYRLFGIFVVYLSDSQLLAVKLEDKLKQKVDEMQEAASSAKNKGIRGAVGLAALGAALGALGFFTGGGAWVAAGAVGAAACGAGAGAVAYNTVVDVKALRELANDIKVCSDKLVVIADQLEKRVDTAIHLDEKAAAALQNLLAFAISDQQKDHRITQLERGNDDRDKKIAQLEEMLRKQGNI